MSEQHTLQDVCNAIEGLESTIERNNTAEATGYTIADSLSNIYYELNRIADILETMSKK